MAAQAYEMFRQEFLAAKGDPEKESKFGYALAATIGPGPAALLIDRLVRNDPIL